MNGEPDQNHMENEGPPMNVLLSMKPKYVEKVLSGEKKYEFRKRIWKKEVDRVFIYSTSHVKRIFASFKPGEIVEGPPDELWDRFKEGSGISEKDFKEYFGNSTSGYAIEVTDLNRLSIDDGLIDPSKGFVVPQSFLYVNSNIQLGREVKLNG